MTFTSLSCSGSPLVSFFFFVRSSGLASHRKAICMPSGDQNGLVAERGRSVIVHASPPVSDSNANCDGGGLRLPPSAPPASAGPRTKAIHLPSGDQRGWASRFPLLRRTGASDPDVATVHSAVS